MLRPLLRLVPFSVLAISIPAVFGAVACRSKSGETNPAPSGGVSGAAVEGDGRREGASASGGAGALGTASATLAVAGEASEEDAEGPPQDYQAELQEVKALPVEVQAAVAAALARPELEAYRGWLKYLRFQAATSGARLGQEAGAGALSRLKDWLQKISDNPKVIETLRGAHEWAYESKVDGSGQPFKLNIPTNYDAARPMPLSLYMHGYGGNHLEHATDIQDHADWFDLGVLGRSRGGRYVALSEADVLDALAYVQGHWAVDGTRLHLTGGSMGGGGTFFLGSRYPGRFASGRPVCGYATDKPLGNLLTFPLYATHSDDDYSVSVLHARSPLDWLKSHGGDVAFDVTTGLGHAAWTYKDGNARALAWAFAKQQRPSREVATVDFTALDGRARRAHWSEIMEWGEERRPAHVVAHAIGANQLELTLDNVARWRLHLGESPFDRSAPLEVRVRLAPPAPVGGEPIGGAPRAAPVAKAAPKVRTVVSALGSANAAPVAAPAWETLTIPVEKMRGSAVDLEWLAKPPAAEHARLASSVAPEALTVLLHTPGGANQVFDGKPLLIVYGTGGSPALQAALRRAGEAAALSSSAHWVQPVAEKGSDGVAHNQNLYGSLPLKADRDVTEQELEQRHLVLIGTAEQNSVVKRLEPQLPIRLNQGEVRFSSGETVPFGGRTVALVYSQPLALERKLLWVASAEEAGYAAGNWATQLLGAAYSGADAVVAGIGRDPELVTTRSFDSRYRWVSGTLSPLLPASWKTQRGLATGIARELRRAARSDFALVRMGGQNAEAPAISVGTTRMADLLATHYHEPLQLLTLSLTEMQSLVKALADSNLVLEPPAPKQLPAGKTFTLAVSADALSSLVGRAHIAPVARMAELTVSEALAGASAL